MLKIKNILIATLLLVSSVKLWAQTEYLLSNNKYQIVYNSASKILKIVNNAYPSDTARFTASFHVLIKNNAATLARLPVTEDIAYHTASWSDNTDFYQAGATRIRTVQDVAQDGNKLHFSYTENSEFKLSATLEVPMGDEYPALTYTLYSKISSGYSIGYEGAPVHEASELDELWQPGIWTEKKFPQSSYLTLAYKCQLPTTMAAYQGLTYGVITDPACFPFDPLPAFRRSTFGVAIRNKEGLSQPMIWAPVLGTPDSKINQGDSLVFRIRLFCGRKSIPEFTEELSQGLYGFSIYDRNNVLGSLNKTLDNMIDYGLSESSRFNETLRAPSYDTDVPGAVKAVSAINAINLAYLTDNDSILKKRGLPMMEFLLSRNSNLYANEETTGTGQTAYNTLGTPVMKLSEMTALYNISGKRMPFLLDFAKARQANLADPAHEQQLRQHIALYKATGDVQYKNQAIAVADQYIADRINQLETAFNYQHHYKTSFWQQLAPKFIDLLEVYDITGQQKYLDAAHKAARRYCLYTWMSPRVPDSSITVNIGGLSPAYRSAGGIRINVPEETVPAWRLSEFGLNPEAASTANSHRAVFMAHHAPFFLRIGALKNDNYLKQVAKSCIIGRYTNFPGYHINTDRTTVYEKPDFPYHSHSELNSTTSMHYNHVWPMMSLVVDYLVNDASTKAAGNINFPAEYAEGDAYMQDKIYGHFPGKFYCVDSATLWMPKALLDVSNQELNYIAARKNDTLMIAFTNQSRSAVSAQVLIDSTLVKITPGATLSIIADNGTAVESQLNGQEFPVTVSGNGITAVILKGAEICTRLQHKFNASQDSSWKKDHLSTPFAMAKAMLLNFGEQVSRAYIYSASAKGKYASVKLKYTVNGVDTLTITDNDYPFEFSVDMPQGLTKFAFALETVDQENILETSEVLTLNRDKAVNAQIQGDKYIIPGESVTIPVRFEGSGPWSFSYSDGTTVKQVTNISENTYQLSVQPVVSTSYTLLDVHDAEESGIASGNVNVHVMSQAVQPVFDGMIRQQQNDGVFTTQQAEVKKHTTFSRESVFTFNTSAVGGERIKKAVFRFYIFKADKNFSVSLGLKGISGRFDNTLNWSGKPQDNDFTTAASDTYFTDTNTPSYVNWDITDYLNNLILSGAPEFTLKAAVSAGNDVLLTGYASEKMSFIPQIIFDEEQVLPLKLSDFTVFKDNDNAKIEWKISPQNLNGSYELWHSTDGLTFNLITETEGLEKNGRKVVYHQPINCLNYYKLVELSSIGVKQGEEIRTLNFGIRKEMVITVYPNPTSRNVGFSIKNFTGKKLETQLYDLSGKIIHSESFNTNSGDYFSLDIQNRLMPGAYFLSVKGDRISKVLKVIYQP